MSPPRPPRAPRTRAPRPARTPRTAPPRPASAGWTFLSNHAHVLLLLASQADLRVRDIADRVGITERAVQNILTELEHAGVVTRTRDGRRNRYLIHPERPLRHPVEAHRTVGDLIRLVHARTPASR